MKKLSMLWLLCVSWALVWCAQQQQRNTNHDWYIKNDNQNVYEQKDALFRSDYKSCSYTSKKVLSDDIDLAEYWECIISKLNTIQDQFVKNCINENLKQSFVWKNTLENAEFESEADAKLFEQDIEELTKECIYYKELQVTGKDEDEMLKNIPVFQEFIYADKWNYIWKNRDNDDFQNYYNKHKVLYFQRDDEVEKQRELQTLKNNANTNNQNNWYYHHGGGSSWFLWYMLWNYMWSSSNRIQWTPDTTSNLQWWNKDNIADSLYKAEQQKVKDNSNITTTRYTGNWAIAWWILWASASRWSRTSDSYHSNVTNDSSSHVSSSKNTNSWFGRWSSYWHSSSWLS